MSNVETLVRDYAEHIDSLSVPVDLDSLVDSSTKPSVRGPNPRLSFTRGMAVGLAAFAVVLAVGAIATLGPFAPASDTAAAGPITSFEDIAGIYENQTRLYFAGYLQFFEDGTWHGSSSRDLVEDRPSEIWESRFEGTKVFLKQTKGICEDNPDAIYEIHLLENGNLQLVAIEDMCLRRAGPFDGAEYAPVP